MKTLKIVQIAMLSVALLWFIAGLAGWNQGMDGAQFLLLWAILLELMWQNRGGGV